MSLPGQYFALTAALPEADVTAETVAVYIEGDGLAWRTPETASDDPTPAEPVALALALRHPGQAVAYLARPCQYASPGAGNCSSDYWTRRRYAPEVVADTNAAVTRIEQHFGAHHVVLVGYSGGGAVATLVAARRDDVALLVTVAGNIDMAAWTQAQRLPPLRGSLDPADAAPALVNIRQVHYVGADDRVVPPSVAEAFARHFAAARRQPRVIVVPHFDHHCCWVQQWPALIDAALVDRP